MGSNAASDQEAALSSEQEFGGIGAVNSKDSEELKQVVPRPDSLIVYEEVVSNTPEDAAQLEDRREEIRGEQISTSSAEPIVADERSSAAANIGSDEDGEQPADERSIDSAPTDNLRNGV